MSQARFVLAGFCLAAGLATAAASAQELPPGVVGQLKISAVAGGFGGVLDVGDFFGQAVVAVGDIDGDGVVDLAVGAPLDDDGAYNAGAIRLLFLAAESEAPGFGNLGHGLPGTLHVLPMLTGGGLLVPDPVTGVVLGPLVTGPAGDLSFSGRWPQGIPAGSSLYLQAWIADPEAIDGFAASNGVAASPP